AGVPDAAAAVPSDSEPPARAPFRVCGVLMKLATATATNANNATASGLRGRPATRTISSEPAATACSGRRNAIARTTDGSSSKSPNTNNTPQRVANGHQSSPASHNDQAMVATNNAANSQSAGLFIIKGDSRYSLNLFLRRNLFNGVVYRCPPTNLF